MPLVVEVRHCRSGEISRSVKGMGNNTAVMQEVDLKC